jgi:hypothetical protein
MGPVALPPFKLPKELCRVPLRWVITLVIGLPENLNDIFLTITEFVLLLTISLHLSNLATDLADTTGVKLTTPSAEAMSAWNSDCIELPNAARTAEKPVDETLTLIDLSQNLLFLLDQRLVLLSGTI